MAFPPLRAKIREASHQGSSTRCPERSILEILAVQRAHLDFQAAGGLTQQAAGRSVEQQKTRQAWPWYSPLGTPRAPEELAAERPTKQHHMASASRSLPEVRRRALPHPGFPNSMK
eukprot:scaffold1433_cov178-Pinguiococcus_pyrenoidosus.AAC.6